MCVNCTDTEIIFFRQHSITSNIFDQIRNYALKQRERHISIEKFTPPLIDEPRCNNRFYYYDFLLWTFVALLWELSFSQVLDAGVSLWIIDLYCKGPFTFSAISQGPTKCLLYLLSNMLKPESTTDFSLWTFVSNVSYSFQY